MTDKFKPGDRVECINKTNSRLLRVGMRGVISSPAYENEGGERFLRVVMPNGEVQGWRDHRWALVQSPTMPDTRDYLNALSQIDL